MVLTGVEIVGIVLAVIPLCITLVEHHQDEIRPFKMLFRYEAQAKTARQKFGIIHSMFHNVIELVITDLALDPHQLKKLLDSFDGTVGASAWKDDELGEAFIDHFGMRAYKTGFLPIVQFILADIRDISSVLGLDLSSADAKVLWTDIDGAKSKLEAGRSKEKISKQSKKEAKKRKERRAKLIFESGTLDPKSEKLYSNVMMLSKMRRDVKELSSARGPRTRFRWPLVELRKHSQNLFHALQAVRACTSHTDHSINLRLECRLKDGSRGPKDPTGDHKPSFHIMMAPPNAPLWHTFQAIMDRDTVSPWRADQRIRYISKNAVGRRAVVHGICETLGGSMPVTFSVDSTKRLHAINNDAASGASIAELPSSVEWISLQEVLRRQQVSANIIAELDYDQILSLGLTLACSFLQLSPTEWVDDAWDASDVTFVR